MGNNASTSQRGGTRPPPRSSSVNTGVRERLEDKIQKLRSRHGADVEAECSPSFICPITQTIMTEPTVIGDGYTYERSAINRWLQQSNRSPATNSVLLNPGAQFPNNNLRGEIYSWVDKKLTEYESPQSQADVEEDTIARRIGRQVEEMVEAHLRNEAQTRAHDHRATEFLEQEFDFLDALNKVKEIISEHLGRSDHYYSRNPFLYTRKVNGKISIADGLRQGRLENPTRVKGWTIMAFLRLRSDTASISIERVMRHFQDF
eukprot:gb/GECG01007827.1/.p1 GENE.gb/GECG01007827.1/~~gb/GECG01007827.1/.p1  ORF type:complete len:261 (+),score=27.51 gb/GECG01007827.1/:1-783(+)